MGRTPTGPDDLQTTPPRIVGRFSADHHGLAVFQLGVSRACKEAWPLDSSLSRYLQIFKMDRRAWPEPEGRILRVFKRKAHQFLEKPPDPDDDFQWLALMQHHGAPTRLLDFTWSPYVAAFFALERATGDAAVWGL